MSTSRRNKKTLNIDEMPLCQEVTFDVFEQRFIPRYYKFMSKSLSRKLSPAFIWTEIMSVIKGGISYYSSIQRYLGRNEYQQKGSPFLNHKEKSTIYFLFLQYEQWKLNVRAFDFLDVVNHIISETALGRGPDVYKKVDYLIIDEVQDLYPKTAQLLL